VTPSPGEVAALVRRGIRVVPDFPSPGVAFQDLTPLFADGDAFRTAIDAIADHHGRGSFEAVAGVEARGFVLAAAVAYATGTGLVPLRKAGRLPGPTLTARYALEYGEATLEVRADSVPPGSRVLVVDDVLATGGTAAAALALVERAGARAVGFSVLVELEALGGRAALAPRDVHALLSV